jgi:hypothetical protein
MFEMGYSQIYEKLLDDASFLLEGSRRVPVKRQRCNQALYDRKTSKRVKCGSCRPNSLSMLQPLFFRLLALCNVFSSSYDFHLAPIPRAEFPCITALLLRIVLILCQRKHRLSSLPRNERYSLPVDYWVLFAHCLQVLHHDGPHGRQVFSADFA